MIKSVRIRNFKAIKDSGKIPLGPLNVFVGHNGTGKSSIIEALEFLQTYSLHGLEAAIEPWFDPSHIWYQGKPRKRSPKHVMLDGFMQFLVSGNNPRNEGPQRNWSLDVFFTELTEAIGEHPEGAFVAVEERITTALYKKMKRVGEPATHNRPGVRAPQPPPGGSLFSLSPGPGMDNWMFLSLDPFQISAPRPVGRGQTGGLERSGANLAAYLKSFLEQDADGFQAMIDAMRYILPYADDFRPESTRDLVSQRSFFQMVESFPGDVHVKLPAWVLSGGTLRVLSILAALRHPTPPSVLFIEELENGLDPRALGFLVQEIKYAIESKRTQVIATTHSPYLLDKLSIDHIITVDRLPGEPPTFLRAADNPELKAWSERFAPGSLYTMGMFRKKGDAE